MAFDVCDIPRTAFLLLHVSDVSDSNKARDIIM